MTKKVLFVVNGLGMGNSTRCYAVIERLYEAGVEIHVLTTNNGLSFFPGLPEVKTVTSMDAFHYGKKDGTLSIARTFRAIPEFYRAYKNKTRRLEQLLNTIEPDLVVTDSEYCILPARRRGVPLVALNNSDVVVSEYRQMQDRPKSIRAQFWAIESMDYLFHRWFFDHVISPCVRIPRRPRKNFHHVGVIVRNSILESAQSARRPPANSEPLTVFLLSGSSFSSKIDLTEWNLPGRAEVVGRTGVSTERLTYHGRLKNNVSTLAKADVLVVNGGFSAVSEALVLGKPTLVIPVPRHAEQYVNARLVADMGHGRVVDEDTVLAELQDLLSTGSSKTVLSRYEPVDGNGAEEAADILLALMDEGIASESTSSEEEDAA